MFALALALVATALAVSCSGGGGGGGASPTQAPSATLRLKFKPAELYNVSPGDVFTIIELGGSDVALAKTSLSGDQFQTLDVEFKPGKSYVFIVYSRGVPYVRTTVMASQITQAKATGTLQVGEINAITTYLTGLLEVSVNNGRQAPDPASAEGKALALLDENFGSAAQDFSALRFDQVMGASFPKTDKFRLRMNRINLLTLYLETVGQFKSDLTAAQITAMAELFAALFDETSANNLLSKLSSPALPPLAGATDGGKQFIATLAGQNLFFQAEGVLAVEDLRRIYWEPQKNPDLALVALQTPNGRVAGAVGGAAKAGVALSLSGNSGGVALIKSTITLADGSYLFEGLLPGSYDITPSLAGHVFNPPLLKAALGAGERKAGFNFDSFLFIKGSLSVPVPDKVLTGIQYTSSDGDTALVGNVVLPDPAKVLQGERYGAKGTEITGAMEESRGTFIGTTTSPSFVLEFQ